MITKPHEPSAIRLEEINKTFEKLSDKINPYIDQLNIDKVLLKQLTDLSEKFVCECKRNIKFYCLKCNKVCKLLEIQPLELPLKVHIVHHLS